MYSVPSFIRISEPFEEWDMGQTKNKKKMGGKKTERKENIMSTTLSKNSA